MYIDTHAHIYGEEFLDDIDETIIRAKKAGALGILLPATDEKSADEAVNLSERYKDFIYPMLGLHPEDIPADYKEILTRMEKRLHQHHPYIAIGEVGLDFYWDTSFKKEQIDAFCTQIEWALKYHLPLMIHSRNAHRELINCLMPYRQSGLCGVFHCFTGTKEEAEELIETFPTFYLGIGGVLTFKKSTLPQVVAESVPLERIVLETDSPYMAPVPYRGKRNEPSFIPSIITHLAKVYDVPSEKIETTTTKNALQIFHLNISRPQGTNNM